MQKLKELTGGLLFTDSFDKKLKKAGLTAQDGYEIQQEIKESIKRKDVEVEGVETRLNFLIEERKKAKESSTAIDMHDETRLKLVSYIDRCEIDISSKISLKKEVKEGKIKDMDTLNIRIDEIKEETYQKSIVENNLQEEPKVVEDKSQDGSDSTDLANSGDMADNEVPFKPTSFKGDESAHQDSTKPEEKPENKEGSEENVLTPEKLARMQKEDKVKELKFLLSQEHNLFPCPSCGAYILKGVKFCPNCGFDILKFIDDLKSGKINISNNESEQVAEEKSSAEDSKKVQDKKAQVSKQKPAVNASTLRAINLKFASVVFLNEKNLKPTKLVKDDYYKSRYNTRLANIKKYVKEEEYAVDGGPLITAKDASVADLKKVLKKHDLMVSGTKDELIQRLGENLSEEGLKKAFPKKSLEVTPKGLEFIAKNIYVLYYDQTSQLRKLMPVEEYDSIFADVEDLDEDKILNLIEMHLNEREGL